MATPTRIRSSRACNRCYSKKVRCDGQDPCDHCQQTDEECIYRTQKKRGPPKGCPPRGGIKKRAVEQTEQKSLNKVRNNVTTKTATATAAPTPAAPSSNNSNGSTSQVPVLYPSNTFFSNTANLTTLAKTPEFASDLSISTPQTTNINVNRNLGAPQAIARFASPPSYSLSESIIDSLLEIYLAFVHPHWPIIYLPLVRDLHEIRGREPILFEAILSVAAATFDQAVDQGYKASTAVSFNSSLVSNEMVEYVRWRILEDNLERQISTVQALILVGVVDLGYGRSSQAYQFGGIACRMALDMGLHEADFERVPPSRIQEGLRVIWGCYILDKVLSAVLQRPVMMRREDLDVPFPDINERDEYDLWMSGNARRFIAPNVYEKMEHAKVHCLSSFQAWANVMYILEQILSNVYSRRAKRERRDGIGSRYEETLTRLDKELRTWKEMLPPQLQWTNHHFGVGPHVLTLRAWYCACMLLLNRPRIPRFETRRMGGKHVSPMSGADICKGAATEICRIMEAYEETFRVRKISSSWVYLIFQAATIHSSFSASQTTNIDHLPPERQESVRRLDQCILWLKRISQTWTSASHHVEILKGLEHTSALTRPASPALGMPRLLEYSMTPSPSMQEANGAWQAFWNDMPASSEDVNLWESFSILFSQT